MSQLKPRVLTPKKLQMPSTEKLPEAEQDWVVILEGPVMGIDVLETADGKSVGGIFFQILVNRIQEWSFTEADGKPAPINRDTVGRLDMLDLAYLLEEVKRVGGADEGLPKVQPSSSIEDSPH